jgi:hypothetical protein
MQTYDINYLNLANNMLKVFKVSCCRLVYPSPLEAFAYLEVWPLGHDGSVLLSIVAQALLCNFLCAGFPSLLSGDADDGYQWKYKLLSTGFHTRDRRRCRAAEGLHL